MRQNFPVRKPLPPPSTHSAQNTPRRAAKPTNEEDEPKRRPRDETDIDYKDYGAEPTMPTEMHRKGVQKVIRSKMHWARFEQVGTNSYVERTRHKKIAVSESRNANPDRDYNKELKQEVQAEDYSVRKFQRIAQVVEKEKEKMRTVQERRSVLKHEYEQWRHSVAEKFDVELQREAALAQERARRQRMWVGVQTHIKVARAFEVLLEIARAQRQQNAEKERAALSIQQIVRVKQNARTLRMQQKRLRELINLIKPYSYFFVRKYRARRKRRLTDLMRTFLIDLQKTNTVKRRISNYLYNVKRLQNAWRNNLRRQRARMLLLSRQWDRTFAFMRSKGKAGRLHDQHEIITPRRSRAEGTLASARAISAHTPGAPASSRNVHALDAHVGESSAAPKMQAETKADETETEQKRVAFKAAMQNSLTINVDEPPKGAHSITPSRSASTHALSAHSLHGPGLSSYARHTPHSKQGTPQPRQGSLLHLPSPTGSHPLTEWERRLHQHNSLHVHMSAKELTMLGRIVHYPAIKWQKLRYILRRNRKEFIANSKQYKEDVVQYQSFMEQKRTVEQVILAFAQDQDSGREMANKLLGSMAGSNEPKKPVLQVVVGAEEMQKSIAQGLQRLIHTSGQLREGAALAEAALKEAAGLAPDVVLSEVARVLSRLALLHPKPCTLLPKPSASYRAWGHATSLRVPEPIIAHTHTHTHTHTHIHTHRHTHTHTLIETS